MTDAPTNPPAGWYPDPSNAGQQRWWNGTGWTDHYQPVPVAGPVLPAPSQPTALATPEAERRPVVYNTWNASEDAKRGKNSFAVTALILGILAYVVLIASPLKWIAVLDALAAIVFGILAIRRSRDTGTGKKRGVWGIVLGAVALSIALVVSLPGFGQGFQAGYDSAQFDMAAVETEIQTGIAEQTGVTVESVECPASPTIEEGATFECVANATDGTSVFVSVRIQDNEGSYVWEVTG